MKKKFLMVSFFLTFSLGAMEECTTILSFQDFPLELVAKIFFHVVDPPKKFCVSPYCKEGSEVCFLQKAAPLFTICKKWYTSLCLANLFIKFLEPQLETNDFFNRALLAAKIQTKGSFQYLKNEMKKVENFDSCAELFYSFFKNSRSPLLAKAVFACTKQGFPLDHYRNEQGIPFLHSLFASRDLGPEPTIKGLEWLITWKAHLNLRDDKGETVLMHLAKYPTLPNVQLYVRLLLDAGADSEITNDLGRKAIDYVQSIDQKIFYKSIFEKNKNKQLPQHHFFQELTKKNIPVVRHCKTNSLL